jgi:maltose alpha-D-glucosyltransferase/alpha-amylase
MQLFGRGLRRRLPTMLGGDPARVRMVYSLAFALPGAPVLFYGEEIGMAENPKIAGRMSVRAPMQWSNDGNGGFSAAAKDQLRRPVVEGKRWGPAAINVADQQRDPGSMLSWMERLIRRRREAPEIVFGNWAVVPVREAEILALRYDWGTRTMLVLHNLAARPRTTSFSLERAVGEEKVLDLFGEGNFSIDRNGTLRVELEGYGCRWLRVRRADRTAQL